MRTELIFMDNTSTTFLSKTALQDDTFFNYRRVKVKVYATFAVAQRYIKRFASLYKLRLIDTKGEYAFYDWSNTGTAAYAGMPKVFKQGVYRIATTRAQAATRTDGIVYQLSFFEFTYMKKYYR